MLFCFIIRKKERKIYLIYDELYKIKEKRCMNEVFFVLFFIKIEENDILICISVGVL